MNPKPIELGRELAYPATTASVGLAMLAFFVALEFAAFGRVLGLFLAALVLPALLRYLMVLLEARALGRDPGPPDADMLLWTGDAWSLLPAVHAAVLLAAVWFLGSIGAAVAAAGLLGVAAVLLPASLAALAISHSPLASINPRIVAGILKRCGKAYWLLPVYILAATGLVAWLARQPVPAVVTEFVACYLLFAGFALTGGVMRPWHFDRDVDIGESRAADAAEPAARLVRQRKDVLTHAYGLISRGNRAGGLAHVYTWLDRDPEQDAAWRWFAGQMLDWEDSDPGLLFAQRYLGRLLGCGEQVAAVKLMLRCLLVNEAFRPLPDDRDAALAAAEACQQEDLACRLR